MTECMLQTFGSVVERSFVVAEAALQPDGSLVVKVANSSGQRGSGRLSADNGGGRRGGGGGGGGGWQSDQVLSPGGVHVMIKDLGVDQIDAQISGAVEGVLKKASEERVSYPVLTQPSVACG